MIKLDGHRRAHRTRKGVGSMGRRSLDSRQRPFRSHDDDPEREQCSDDCASALRGTRVDVPHDVADCSSGSPTLGPSVDLTPCRDLPATAISGDPRETANALTAFAR